MVASARFGITIYEYGSTHAKLSFFVICIIVLARKLYRALQSEHIQNYTHASQIILKTFGKSLVGTKTLILQTTEWAITPQSVCLCDLKAPLFHKYFSRITLKPAQLQSLSITQKASVILLKLEWKEQLKEMHLVPSALLLIKCLYW